MTSSGKTINFDQGAPVPLDPIILRARDDLLEKYSDKSFDEQITFYKAVIEGEKDSLQRLSAMAARVYILRKRLAFLAGNLMEDQLDELSTKQRGFDMDSSLAETSDAKDPEVIGSDKSWMRLKIVDSSEVNGVRFPSGVVIDVRREDGEKLIELGKADFVSTEESRQFKSEEGLEVVHEELEAVGGSEEGTTEEVKLVNEAEDGTTDEAESVNKAEDGTTEEVEAVSGSEEGTTEEVKLVNEAEDGTTDEAELVNKAEDGTTEEVELVNEAEDGTTDEAELVNKAEDGTTEEVEAVGGSEEGTTEEVELVNEAEDGTTEEVETLNEPDK